MLNNSLGTKEAKAKHECKEFDIYFYRMGFEPGENKWQIAQKVFYL